MLALLSERGKKNVKDLPALVQAHFNALNDMYEPIENPQGHINMGTAETRLVDREAIALLKTVTNRMELQPEHLHYNKFHGSDEFRSTIADYWQKILFKNTPGPTLGKDNIATCTGCTVALEMLATLLADPGDVFLIPAPFYSGFVDDIHDRPGVVPVAVHCTAELEQEAFESALIEQQGAGKRVRAVLFSSPNNPLGTVYTKEAIQNIIEFCMKHNLDLISDEIYAQTVFDPAAAWVSTLSLVPSDYIHRVHVTSSFAKDFALSGFRTGFCISYNPSVIRGMETITYYSCVSSHTQATLTALMKAPELKSFMDLSRKRLGESCERMNSGLNQIGIKTAKAQAGIFLWADFRDYMENADFPEEHVLWSKLYTSLKINISPGQLFHAKEPGWFRLCYAHDIAVVEEACRRLSTLKKVRSHSTL